MKMAVHVEYEMNNASKVETQNLNGRGLLEEPDLVGLKLIVKTGCENVGMINLG
jgi:hypothetical protein